MTYSYTTLWDVTRDYGVLFSVALYKKISFLDADSARRLVTDPVKGIYEYDDEAVEYILEASGRQPYYTQLICHSVFSRYAETGRVITSQEVNSIIPEALERCTAVLKFVWDQSSEPEMVVLSVMADSMSGSNQPMTEAEIQQALRSRQITLPDREFNIAIRGLLNKEALIQDDGYKFPVDLLRLYLRENHKIEWVREDLRELLEGYGAAKPVLPAVRKRSRLAIAIAVLAFVAIGSVALGTLLSPTSPLSVDTVLPTAIPPEPGIFMFARCGLPSVGGEELAKLKLCVESVEVSQRGEMKFNISWEAQIQEGLEVDGQLVNTLLKESDAGSTQMYITDDMGNRYDFIDLGGAALEVTLIQSGNKADGWFLFPPPIDQARRFTFHDDDNFWAIAGIVLK